MCVCVFFFCFFFTYEFLNVIMIGYARYDYAKYDSNILKQIKRCMDYLSSHGYPRATISCLEPCQLAGLSFIPRRLTVTAVFVNFDQHCRWYGYTNLLVRSHSHMSRVTALTIRLHVRPQRAKTLISLCIRAV